MTMVNYVLGGKIRGVRYLQSFLLFLCLFAAYLLRVSISVAIVAMTPDKGSADFLTETHYHIPVSKNTFLIKITNCGTASVSLECSFPGLICVHFSYIF